MVNDKIARRRPSKDPHRLGRHVDQKVRYALDGRHYGLNRGYFTCTTNFLHVESRSTNPSSGAGIRRRTVGDYLDGSDSAAAAAIVARTAATLARLASRYFYVG